MLSCHREIANGLNHCRLVCRRRCRALAVEGSLESQDCSVAYQRVGQTLALATIGRNLESLKVEARMEAGVQ